MTLKFPDTNAIRRPVPAAKRIAFATSEYLSEAVVDRVPVPTFIKPLCFSQRNTINIMHTRKIST